MDIIHNHCSFVCASTTSLCSRSNDCMFFLNASRLLLWHARAPLRRLRIRGARACMSRTMFAVPLETQALIVGRDVWNPSVGGYGSFVHACSAPRKNKLSLRLASQSFESGGLTALSFMRAITSLLNQTNISTRGHRATICRREARTN